jgi:hypothetical protein
MGVFRETGILQAACGELLASGYNTWCGHLLRPIDAERSSPTSTRPATAAAAAAQQNLMRGMFKKLDRLARRRAGGGRRQDARRAPRQRRAAAVLLVDGHDAVHLSSRRTARTARHALLQIGARDPRRFLRRAQRRADARTQAHHRAPDAVRRPAQLVACAGDSARGGRCSTRCRRAHRTRADACSSRSSSRLPTTRRRKHAATATTMSAAARGTEPLAERRAADQRLVLAATALWCWLRGAARSPAAGAVAALAARAGSDGDARAQADGMALREGGVDSPAAAARAHCRDCRALARSARAACARRAMPTITGCCSTAGEHVSDGELSPADAAHGARHAASSSVIIYDLKAATKWHVLEGHSGAMAAVAFSDNGRFIASYSYADKTVRVWSTSRRRFSALARRACKAIHKINAVELAHDDVASLLATRLTWRRDGAASWRASASPTLTLTLHEEAHKKPFLPPGFCWAAFSFGRSTLLLQRASSSRRRSSSSAVSSIESARANAAAGVGGETAAAAAGVERLLLLLGSVLGTTGFRGTGSGGGGDDATASDDGVAPPPSSGADALACDDGANRARFTSRSCCCSMLRRRRCVNARSANVSSLNKLLDDSDSLIL